MVPSLKHSVLFSLLVAVLFLAAGCGSSVPLASFVPEARVSEEVDSIVVPPFSNPASIPMNSEDLKLYRDSLIAQLKLVPGIKIFNEPPTEFANSMILQGVIREQTLHEVTHQEFFLRAFHLVVDLELTQRGRVNRPRIFRRNYSYQKIYMYNQRVPFSSFDLNQAVKELNIAAVDFLFPGEESREYPLDTAVDPASGADLALPNLEKGNDWAEERLPERAIKLWRLVLFDPVPPETTETFRLTKRVYRKLEDAKLPPEVLEKIRPLAEHDDLTLVEYRDALRNALGGPTPHEAIILNSSSVFVDRIHRNLAAANANMGWYYYMVKQYDLASYHWIRAIAHNPAPEMVELWSNLQRDRKLMPPRLKDERAAELFLLVPPPRGMVQIPGEKSNEIIPQGAIVDSANRPPALQPLQQDRQQDQRENTQPASSGESPPPDGLAIPTDQGALPPIERAEGAAR